MTYQLLDGSHLAKLIREQLMQAISGFVHVRAPKLAVVLVGDNPASHTYVSAKERACYQVGIETSTHRLSPNISACELNQLIDNLNKDDLVDGILIQLPLPHHLDPMTVAAWVTPDKDVDGLHPLNIGRVVYGDPTGFIPCTPKAIIRLLKHYDVATSAARVTIVGRSLIVGRPLSILMSHAFWGGQSSVTLAHSQSHNLQELCKNADILIVAIGRSHFLTSDFVGKPRAIIDVGITRTQEGTLCGDVDFERVKLQTSWITPVPGGVGPMTVAMLLENVCLSWSRRVKLPVEFPILFSR